MTSWWQLSTGTTPDGSAQNAHSTGGFQVIPDGTTAIALAVKFTLENGFNPPFYNIHWKILSGEFKDRIVFHGINTNSHNEKVSDRAKQMMMRIFKLCHVIPANLNEPPTDFDLSKCLNKPLGIKIQEYIKKSGQYVGQSANSVSEVHPSEDFECATGTSIQLSGFHVDSALSRNSEKKIDLLDGDIPW